MLAIGRRQAARAEVPGLARALGAAGRRILRLETGLGQGLVLASPLTGRLVAATGRPLEGVRVRRSWSWVIAGRHGAEETETDAEGRFGFGAVRRSGWGAVALPHQPEIRQEILAWPEGREVLLLRLRKPNYAMDGERNGRPLRLHCRTDLVPEAQGAFWGSCTCED
jgi:hypothetical protein